MSSLIHDRDWGLVMMGNDEPIPDGIVADWCHDEIAVFRDDPMHRDFFSTLAMGYSVVSPGLGQRLTEVVSAQIQLLPIRMESADGGQSLTGFSLLHPLILMKPSGLDPPRGEPAIICSSDTHQLLVTLPLLEALQSSSFQGILFQEMTY